MNESQYQQTQGGFQDRGEGRERRDEYQYSQPQPGSPPTSASPFAFAPPPLSSLPGPGSSRPPMPMHHSDPTVQVPQYPYYPQKPGVTHHNTFPSYPASAPMGYRSYSSETQKASPQQSNLTRTPSLNTTTIGQDGMQSQSPSEYHRQLSNGYGNGTTSQSPQRQPMFTQQSYYGQPYGQPTAADMPRSFSYPSSYSQLPYPSYDQAMSTPSLSSHSQPPSLDRHNTTSVIGEGMAGMDLGRQGPSLGYSFANRLPLVDRPFKCDECVQSFNRNHDLKRHKRIHLSVKPFGCDKCGKTFSRKDALRRHWLVKGCRGEEGATAQITPMYPLNHSQTPALTPPTPPQSISPTEPDFSSFSHPSAPPSLATLPARQASDNNSQILVTPNEIAARHQMARTMGPGAGPPLEETLVLDPVLTSSGSQRNSSGSDGYFEGVVGLKQDGTALIEKNVGSSPYARYPNSPSTNLHPHPYRRPSTLTSPNRGMSQQHSSPTLQYHPAQRSFSPSNLANDGKPVFAMPFPPQNGGYGLQQQDGMLAPPIDMGTKMEKQGSADGDPTTWQRWHRPSFPFPPPPGVNYDFDPASPADVQTYA